MLVPPLLSLNWRSNLVVKDCQRTPNSDEKRPVRGIKHKCNQTLNIFSKGLDKKTNDKYSYCKTNHFFLKRLSFVKIASCNTSYIKDLIFRGNLVFHICIKGKGEYKELTEKQPHFSYCHFGLFSLNNTTIANKSCILLNWFCKFSSSHFLKVILQLAGQTFVIAFLLYRLITMANFYF